MGASLDNFLTLKTDAYVTGGLTDAIAVSLSGSYATQGNGWGYDPTTGHDTYKIHDNWAVRGKMLIQPDSHTSITLIADYQSRNEDNGPYYRAYPGTTERLPGASTSPRGTRRRSIPSPCSTCRPSIASSSPTRCR